MSEPSATPSSESSGYVNFSFTDLDKVIDALTRMIDVLWSKSPYLGWFAVVMILALPFYFMALYTWGSVKKAEARADNRAEKARNAEKERRKNASGGK